MNSNLDFFEVFPWNANFETGHDVIDAQHQKLTELLNKLANTLTAGEQDIVAETFSELAEYANFHFKAEEKIWQDAFGEDDPWFNAHQHTHASFLPQVLAIKEVENEKPFELVVEDIVKFLIRWLAYHIIDDDKRLAIVVRELSAGQTFEEAKRISEFEMNGVNKILIETVLMMYDRVSSRTLDLMRERHARKLAEEELLSANKKLAELSITDQLTGLYNRRHFENVFRKELRRTARENDVLTYILFDLDFFKKLNDHYGHVMGDVALKEVGRKLKDICRRPGDTAFRVGGEEFAVLSSGRETHNEEKFGEIIRHAIEGLKIPHEKSSISDFLTASIGLISLKPTSDTSPEELFKIADSRLYKAKEQGRNRVVDRDD